MPFIFNLEMPKGEEVIMTNVVFINVISMKSFEKVVATDERTSCKFIEAASKYYNSKGFNTIAVENELNPDFYEVRSLKNGETIAVAGPMEQDEKLFWSKHTRIKKFVATLNGEFQRPKGQKFNFYAVITANFCGFVLTWKQCESLTKGRKAKFKGFNAIEAAKVWMRENNAPDSCFEGYTDLKQIK